MKKRSRKWHRKSEKWIPNGPPNGAKTDAENQLFWKRRLHGLICIYIYIYWKINIFHPQAAQKPEKNDTENALENDIEKNMISYQNGRQMEPKGKWKITQKLLRGRLWHPSCSRVHFYVDFDHIWNHFDVILDPPGTKIVSKSKPKLNNSTNGVVANSMVTPIESARFRLEPRPQSCNKTFWKEHRAAFFQKRGVVN